MTGYDPAAAIALAMTAFDLPAGQTPGKDFENKVLSAFLPKGTVTMTLNPSFVAGAGYKVTALGSVEAGPQTTTPTGTAKVTLSGIDTIRKALMAAPRNLGAKAMIMLGAFSGLANPDGQGNLVWTIDATTPGKVTINGMDLSSLGGGQ